MILLCRWRRFRCMHSIVKLQISVGYILIIKIRRISTKGEAIQWLEYSLAGLCSLWNLFVIVNKLMSHHTTKKKEN